MSIQSQYVLKSRKKHKERYNKYMCEYNSRPEPKQKKRAAAIKWANANFERVLLSNTKRSAKVRGYEFNLELSDIIIPEHCPLLKCKITTIQGQGILDTNASVDRIDNSKGYIKGNIRVISHLANQMKSCATHDQLIQFAKSILEC